MGGGRPARATPCNTFREVLHGAAWTGPRFRDGENGCGFRAPPACKRGTRCAADGDSFGFMVFSGVPCNAVQPFSRDVARPHEARRSGCRGLDEILHHEGPEGTRSGQPGARADMTVAFVLLRIRRGSFG